MKRLCIMLAAVVGLLPLPQAFSMPITGVAVQVIDDDHGTSAPLLAKMNKSMQVVAEQLLLEHDTETTSGAQADYEHLFTEIGDRVFTGYELRQVQLNVGATTQVELHVRPWTATIQEVKVDLQFSGMDEATAAMLQQSLPNLEAELQHILEGASVDAVDWASSVLRQQVRAKAESALPEFKVAVDLVQEGQPNQATVQVIVYPVGEGVRNIAYEMHSETIPNILLMQFKYRYADRCGQLRGLPVAYVQHHQKELEQMLVKELQQERILHDYDLVPVVTLTPGPDLGIDIKLSTRKYKFWAEGYADLGRKDDNLSGKVHAGKYIGPNSELFVEEELVTDGMQWYTGFGYAQDWGKSTWSYRRRVPTAENVYKLEYKLSPKWSLRAERYDGQNRNEYALRYRIHEFLSCEYVYGGHESYFRIIGNL